MIHRREPTEDFVRRVQEYVDGTEPYTDDLDWYLVGGAVRDHLMGRECHDFDFVVVGESHESMVSRGFEPVENRAFPVYVLSDGTEFALARKEHSTGMGHDEFEVESGVSLEEDLRRRAIRFNAMAMSPDGEIIDPYDGREDLANRRLDLVEFESLLDDPLRVVRVARFAAKFSSTIDDGVIAMMDVEQQIQELPAERLLDELVKVLAADNAGGVEMFFETLERGNVLEDAYPFVSAMKGVLPGPRKYHREKDVYEHTMRALNYAETQLDADWKTLFMILVHDVGKIRTSFATLPHHYGHSAHSLRVIEELAENYNLSNDLVRLLKIGARNHHRYDKVDEMNMGKVVDFVSEVGVREMNRLRKLVLADKNGRRPPFAPDFTEHEARLNAARHALDTVKGTDLIKEGYDPNEGGERFGNILKQRRVEKARETLK